MARGWIRPGHQRLSVAHGTFGRHHFPQVRLRDRIPDFVLAAALAGAFPNLATLIAAKVIQGIGSTMIQGNGMATIISAFPDSQRDKALGYHLSVVASGAITGPVVGGFLISALKWRWVFTSTRSHSDRHHHRLCSSPGQRAPKARRVIPVCHSIGPGRRSSASRCCFSYWRWARCSLSYGANVKPPRLAQPNRLLRRSRAGSEGKLAGIMFSRKLTGFHGRG